MQPKALQPSQQEYAASEILSLGLAPEAQSQIKHKYAAHKGFLAPPLLDPDPP